MSTFRPNINGDILVWARMGAGYPIGLAAKKIGVAEERLAEAESGERGLTFRQLEKAAHVYSQPLEVFFLDVAPPPPSWPVDYRTLDSDEPSLAPELRKAIRWAEAIQDLALDLLDLGEDPGGFSFKPSSSESPEVAGWEFRGFLGVSAEQQERWSSSYEAYDQWRQALDRVSVLALQFSRVEVSLARGFSLWNSRLPVVATNSKDSPNGRIFTLFHEVGHLCSARSGGVCDLTDTGVEAWCNAFSAAVLVPSPVFLTSPFARECIASKGQPSDESIWQTAKQFWVSREVIVRRALAHSLVDRAFYLAKRRTYLAAVPAKKKSGGPPVHRKVVAKLGRAYVKRVLRAYDEDLINAADLADYLESGLDHVPKIRSEASIR